MELQALRYAAMVSSLTYDQLVDAHARYRGEPANREAAAKAVLDFLGAASEDDIDLGDEVRVILVSADFSVEITTTVLWLNKHGLDITCIRLKPYRLEGQILVDIQQLIPLPEAEQYEIKIREKSREKSRSRSARHDIMRRFWSQLIERSKGRTETFANRSAAPQQWLSGGMGRSGFNLNFVLVRDQARVECFITAGRDSAQRKDAIWSQLRQKASDIEQAFGGALDRQELPDAQASRICKTLPGGWETPEEAWPELQDQMIDNMVRLEAALKPSILSLKIPDEVPEA